MLRLTSGFPLIILFLLASGCAYHPPNPGDIRISKTDDMEMVFVPAGDFEMGAAIDDPRADTDEFPPHRVHLDAFWIDRTEVTNAMYIACMDAGACTKPARTGFYLQAEYAEHPVIGISWDQAVAYCDWVGRRLPSEAEWEKAARGMDGRIFPWGNEEPSAALANYNQNINGTTPVGRYPEGASPYGALDMAGNAWEWTLDSYVPDFYAEAPTENPIRELPVNRRVLRGGNWDSNADGIRATNRFWAYPGRNDTDGFRCAQTHQNGL